MEIRERAIAYWQTAVVPLEESWMAKVRREIPHARVIAYEGAGHYVYLDRATDVLAEMKRFYSTLQ